MKNLRCLFGLVIVAIVVAGVVGAGLYFFGDSDDDDGEDLTVSEVSNMTIPTPLPDSSDANNESDNPTVELGYAEIITDPKTGEAGGVEYFQRDLGNANLEHDFVYNDPRRMEVNGGHPGITYAINTGYQSSDANLTDQVGWMYRAIQVWDDQQCSDLTLKENTIAPGTPGAIQTYMTTGRMGRWQADITEVGFFSGDEFPYFKNKPSVLGVTLTIFWVDENGNYTDVDGNGKYDVAFREVYYNDDYNWADNGLEGPQENGPALFDFPSVAIHEVGHSFSQGHFGNIGTHKGELVANPRAMMNAIYDGIYREPSGRDVGNHCSNWAQWPNN